MPKSISQLDAALDPSDTDLVYAGQITRTPRDRKWALPTFARALLSRLLTHPAVPWNPDAAPTQVMVRREGASIPADSIGLMDLKALYNDAATPVQQIELTGTPTSTFTLALNSVPGNLRAFVVSAEAMGVSGKLILSGDLNVNHSLVVHNSGLSQPLILEYPAGTEILRIQPGKTAVVARGSTGYHYAMDTLIPLPEKTNLTGTELLRIDDAGVDKKTPSSTFLWRRYRIPLTAVTLKKFNAGADITIAALGSGATGRFDVAVSPDSKVVLLDWEFSLYTTGVDNTANANHAEFAFDFSSIPGFPLLQTSQAVYVSYPLPGIDIPYEAFVGFAQLVLGTVYIYNPASPTAVVEWKDICKRTGYGPTFRLNSAWTWAA